jgi:hypothetical protein
MTGIPISAGGLMLRIMIDAGQQGAAANSSRIASGCSCLSRAPRLAMGPANLAQISRSSPRQGSTTWRCTMEVERRDTADLKRLINDLQDQIEDLKADQLLARLIVGRLVAKIVRREKEPKKLLEVLRVSSLWTLSEDIVLPSSPEVNERLREKTRTKHEQFFEEMNRTLGPAGAR